MYAFFPTLRKLPVKKFFQSFFLVVFLDLFFDYTAGKIEKRVLIAYNLRHLQRRML